LQLTADCNLQLTADCNELPFVSIGNELPIVADCNLAHTTRWMAVVVLVVLVRNTTFHFLARRHHHDALQFTDPLSAEACLLPSRDAMASE